MIRTRVIPVLLLNNGGLEKTVRFKKPIYIGDPINAVRIFNNKEVDELTLLDISASIQGRGPDYQRIEEIVSEAFMPIGVGGGITNINQIERLFNLGIEKVILNTILYENISLIKEASSVFGSQSIVVCLDVKKKNYGWNLYSHGGRIKQRIKLSTFVRKIQDNGAGEIVINSIDRDGTMKGYDLDLIKEVSSLSDIPVVALGGAGSLLDFKKAVNAKASAVGTGSFFVFQGIHKAVLISYPNSEELEKYLKE